MKKTSWIYILLVVASGTIAASDHEKGFARFLARYENFNVSTNMNTVNILRNSILTVKNGCCSAVGTRTIRWHGDRPIVTHVEFNVNTVTKVAGNTIYLPYIKMS